VVAVPGRLAAAPGLRVAVPGRLAAAPGLRAAVPGWLAAALAGLLAAGCAVGMPAAYQATPDTCYAFVVQALHRHITVTSVPRACAGLSHAQVNLAAARAVREVVGPRPKAVARRLAYQEGAHLAALINTVPPPGQEPLAAAPSRHSTGIPLSLAALTAWIATAAAGAYLLAGWLAHDGPRLRRRRRTRAAGRPPVVVISHFALAVAGLGIWIAFAATEMSALAWIAVGLILPIAGLGMAALAAALPEPAPSAWPPGQRPPLTTVIAEAAAPRRAAMPVTVIAVHGVLATATILLVLLAAIGAA